MALNIALYLDTVDYNGTPDPVHNWRRLDMDKSVQVILNDSIKDAKDVAKVMTAYSQPFNLPASKTNNKAFKYFYSHNALTGFDARRKHPALLKINGFDFKKGFLKLNSVNMRDNLPQSYSVQFFGELASLKDILGEDYLHSLSYLNRYNHAFDHATAKNGFENGLAFDFTDLDNIGISTSINGDIKYPFISHTRGFEYDNDGLHRILSLEERDGTYIDPVTGNPAGSPYSPVPADRLHYADLKPALRVSKIFDAIEAGYPQIKFNKTWLQSSPFNDLFIWLHRTKGYVSYEQGVLGEDSHAWRGTLGDPDSGVEMPYITGSGDGVDLRSSDGSFCTDSGGGGNTVSYTVSFGFSSGVGSGNVTLRMTRYKGNTMIGDPIEEDFDISNSFANIDTSFAHPWGCGWRVELEILADNTVVSLVPGCEVIKFVYGGTQDPDFEYYADYGFGTTTLNLTNQILVPALMPKKKIIEFLTDIFKMFNLVAYEERDFDGSYKINIKPLDDYLDGGTAYDITDQVDISASTVERITPYGSIEFDWADPKTFLAINQAEITGDDFGAVRFDAKYFDEGPGGDNSLLFDGGKYEVLPKLEKMMYERMVDVDTEAQTDIQWGWFVNDNKENVPEPTIGEALFMFINQETEIDTSIRWNTDEFSLRYNRPSSVIADGSQTLHFNGENDEWTLLINEESLFKNYYDKYIAGIYSPYARRFKVSAYMKASTFMKVKLQDTIVINNVPFTIEKIKTNLTTGKSELDLLRMTDFERVYTDPNTEGALNWSAVDQNWENVDDNWENM